MNGKDAVKYYKETEFFKLKNAISDEEYEARTFKSELNHFLNEKDLKLSTVAYRIQMDPKQISRYSTGERTPDRITVIKIALGIGLNIEDTNRLLESADYASITIKKKIDSIILDFYDQLVETFKKQDDGMDFSIIEQVNEQFVNAGFKEFIE